MKHSASLDPFPTVIQQPTSDLREETQPASVAQTAEIKEHKHQLDLANDPDLANGVMDYAENSAPAVADPVSDGIVADAVDPVTVAADAVPPKEAPATPPSENTHDMPSAPTEVAAVIKEDTPHQATTDQRSAIPTADLPHHPPVPVPEGTTAEAPVDPAPSPAAQAETSAPLSNPEEPPSDQIMQDAPPPPMKLAREREDDDLEDGPAAKRSKTDDDAASAPDFKVPQRPVIDTQVNGAQTEEPSNAPPMTSVQQKALQRVIQNVKRIQASAAFRQPVDPVALNIPNYPNIIKSPMDLRTLEENLKAYKYLTVDAFVADFNLIVENCQTFNGAEHSFTKLAYEMKNSFQKQMEKVPGPDVSEPSAADKKKKSIIPPAPKVAPVRRESRSSLPGSARSPVSAGSPQTFALGPTGTPLIRRDSTFGDGRPKREIHPPAPRDLPYANSKPKKKKYQLELKFCDKVLTELLKPKYSHYAWPFLQPVDPVALNIPTYYSLIKKPMDFGTIRTKLDQGQYENAKEFDNDVKLVFQNCYKFNPSNDPIHQSGKSLEAIYDSEFSKKRDYVEANTPGSGPQSAGSSEAEDSDDEVEEDEEEEEEQNQLQLLQKQIREMSKQVELIQKKKASPPVSNKKVSKGAKPVRRDSKKVAPAKTEKKVQSKPTKKEKAPYVTYEQKQDISNRINSLSESKMATALKIIRDNMPNLKVRSNVKKIFLYISNDAILNYQIEELELNYYRRQGVQEDELELDIDELSDEVLHKLLTFVRKHAPKDDDPHVRPAPIASSAAPTRKKNKPMSKTEQEARIAQVQNSLNTFNNPGAIAVCKSHCCNWQYAKRRLTDDVR